MNLSITNSPNFKAIQLSAKEAEKAESYISRLIDAGISVKERRDLQNKMFDTFNSHIKQEAHHRTACRIFEEVFAEMCLKFSELLYDIQNNPTLEQFLEKLNGYKPSKDTMKSEYIHQSLDTNVYDDKDILKKINLITSEHLPKPKSSEYLESIRERINKIIDKQDLPPVIKARIKARLKGIKFKDIAQKDNINVGVAYRSVQKGVMKLQHANSNLPKNCIEKAEAIANTFDCDVETAIQFILKNPAILGVNPETIIQNIKNVAKLFNYPEKKLIKISLKYPDICLQRPNTLMNNVSQSAKLLGCSEKVFITSGINLPPLLYLKPETILNNAQKASELFNCPLPAFIKAALRQPQLFCQKPETLKSNIENTAKNIRCSEKELIKAALYEAPLFCLKPETILRNVKESSKLFNCSEKEFVQVALKTPKLFYLRAETLKRKAEEISKNFGCTEYEFIKIALDHPHLLCQNPKTLGEKLKVENYYRKVKNEELKKIPCKTSKESVYLNILTYLLQKAKIEGTEEFVKIKRNFNLPEFTRTFANRTFSFEIPEDDAAEWFIDFVQKTSIDTIGKNIFEFKIAKTITT